MKKIIAYIGTYIFYYLGDFISRLIEFEIFNFLYSTYKKLMMWSFMIQDWGKSKGPWINVENQENNQQEVED